MQRDGIGDEINKSVPVLLSWGVNNPSVPFNCPFNGSYSVTRQIQDMKALLITALLFISVGVSLSSQGEERFNDDNEKIINAVKNVISTCFDVARERANEGIYNLRKEKPNFDALNDSEVEFFKTLHSVQVRSCLRVSAVKLQQAAEQLEREGAN